MPLGFVLFFAKLKNRDRTYVCVRLCASPRCNYMLLSVVSIPAAIAATPPPEYFDCHWNSYGSRCRRGRCAICLLACVSRPTLHSLNLLANREMLSWRNHDNNGGSFIRNDATARKNSSTSCPLYLLHKSESLRLGNVKVFCGGTQACVTENRKSIKQQKTSKMGLDGAFVSSFAFTLSQLAYFRFLCVSRIPNESENSITPVGTPQSNKFLHFHSYIQTIISFALALDFFSPAEDETRNHKRDE